MKLDIRPLALLGTGMLLGGALTLVGQSSVAHSEGNTTQRCTNKAMVAGQQLSSTVTGRAIGAVEVAGMIYVVACQ